MDALKLQLMTDELRYNVATEPRWQNKDNKPENASKLFMYFMKSKSLVDAQTKNHCETRMQQQWVVISNYWPVCVSKV